MTIRTALTAAGLLAALATTTAEAQRVYTWTDAAGEEHFTDNLSAVPEPYRSDYIRTEGAESEAAKEVEEAGAGSAADARKKAAKAKKPPAAPDPAKAPEQRPVVTAAPHVSNPVQWTPEEIQAERRRREIDRKHLVRVIDSLREGLAAKTEMLKQGDGSSLIRVPMDEKDLERLRREIDRIKGEIEYYEHKLKEHDRPVPEYPDSPASGR